MDNLEKEYLNLSHVLNNNMTLNSIDIRGYGKLTPTILIPIIYYAKKYYREIISSKKVQKYLETIIKQEDTKWTTFLKTNYEYFLKMPTTSKIRLEEGVSTKFVENLDHTYGGWWFQSYIIEELTGNIYEHAFGEHPIDVGINYAQVYPEEKLMDITIFDNGISIPGNYTEHGIKYADDCHALDLALSRKSTGQYIKSSILEERGNGIRTIIKKLTEENKGEALIVSRNGYLHITNQTNYKYGHVKAINGTLITLRLKQNHVSQFMDISEFEFPNPYVYKGGKY